MKLLRKIGLYMLIIGSCGTTSYAMENTVRSFQYQQEQSKYN